MRKKKKICRDCVFSGSGHGIFKQCDRPKQAINLVTGYIQNPFCSEERKLLWPFSCVMRKCGRTGRYYKRKL